MGDQPEWNRLVPLVWRMIADPGGRYDYPAPPRDLDEATAWWAPLLQLCWYSLGWPRPDIGMRAWVHAGRPVDDPRLAVIDRLWGDLIDYFCAWLWTGGASLQSQMISHELGLPHPPAPEVAADRVWLAALESRILDGASHLPYGGGGDPLHLAAHGFAGMGTDAVGVLCRTSTQGRRAAVVLDGYSGWYRALAARGASLPELPGERSWRVDVTVAPVGWLGTYRRSRVSGRWFSGPHRLHRMGIG